MYDKKKKVLRKILQLDGLDDNNVATETRKIGVSISLIYALLFTKLYANV